MRCSNQRLGRESSLIFYVTLFNTKCVHSARACTRTLPVWCTTVLKRNYISLFNFVSSFYSFIFMFNSLELNGKYGWRMIEVGTRSVSVCLTGAKTTKPANNMSIWVDTKLNLLDGDSLFAASHCFYTPLSAHAACTCMLNLSQAHCLPHTIACLPFLFRWYFARNRYELCEMWVDDADAVIWSNRIIPIA